MKLRREVSVSGLVGTIADLCFRVLDALYLPLVVDPNAAPVSPPNAWKKIEELVKKIIGKTKDGRIRTL